MRKLAPLIFVISLASCSYPVQRDEQGAGPGQLYFPGALQIYQVAIDGGVARAAAQYDGKMNLEVPAGMHRVVITSGTTVILDKKVYVGAGAIVPVREQ